MSGSADHGPAATDGSLRRPAPSVTAPSGTARAGAGRSVLSDSGPPPGTPAAGGTPRPPAADRATATGRVPGDDPALADGAALGAACLGGSATAAQEDLADRILSEALAAVAPVLGRGTGSPGPCSTHRAVDAPAGDPAPGDPAPGDPAAALAVVDLVVAVRDAAPRWLLHAAALGLADLVAGRSRSGAGWLVAGAGPVVRLLRAVVAIPDDLDPSPSSDRAGADAGPQVRAAVAAHLCGDLGRAELLRVVAGALLAVPVLDAEVVGRALSVAFVPLPADAGGRPAIVACTDPARWAELVAAAGVGPGPATAPLEGRDLAVLCPPGHDLVLDPGGVPSVRLTEAEVRSLG